MNHRPPGATGGGGKRGLGATGRWRDMQTGHLIPLPSADYRCPPCWQPHSRGNLGRFQAPLQHSAGYYSSCSSTRGSQRGLSGRQTPSSYAPAPRQTVTPAGLKCILGRLERLRVAPPDLRANAPSTRESKRSRYAIKSVRL